MKIGMTGVMVEDMEKEFKKLKESDVVFKKTPTNTKWGTEALFDDTCGNFIQLHQV